MEAVRASGIKKYIPNIVSCIRIAGTFSLPFLAWESWERNITLPIIGVTLLSVPVVWIIVYVVLLCSDKLDGTLARKLKVESEVGAAIDAVGDILLIVMGATLCFVWFVNDNLETWQFRLYVGMMIIAALNRAVGLLFSKIYHGKANMTHSYHWKIFIILCSIAIPFWALLRTIPEWTIYPLFALNVFCAIDENLYVIRTKKYNVDFKGHGFEKYERREK